MPKNPIVTAILAERRAVAKKLKTFDRALKAVGYSAPKRRVGAKRKVKKGAAPARRATARPSQAERGEELTAKEKKEKAAKLAKLRKRATAGSGEGE